MILTEALKKEIAKVRALEAERDALTVQRDYWYELTNRAMLLLPGWPEEGIHVPAAEPSPAPAPETPAAPDWRDKERRKSIPTPADDPDFDWSMIDANGHPLRRRKPPAKPEEG